MGGSKVWPTETLVVSHSCVCVCVCVCVCTSVCDRDTHTDRERERESVWFFCACVYVCVCLCVCVLRVCTRAYFTTRATIRRDGVHLRGAVPIPVSFHIYILVVSVTLLSCLFDELPRPLQS